MRKSVVGALAFAAVAALMAGCGSSEGQPDEAKVREKLSGPPSLKEMADKHPMGAKQPPGTAAGGQPAPGATTTGTTGN
jgi:hypothetical protein